MRVSELYKLSLLPYAHTYFKWHQKLGKQPRTIIHKVEYMPITEQYSEMRRKEAFIRTARPTNRLNDSTKLEKAAAYTTRSYGWLCCAHKQVYAKYIFHHPFPFHSIRNSVGCCWLNVLTLKMYIFGFVLGLDEFNSFSFSYSSFRFFSLSFIVSIIVEQTLLQAHTTPSDELEFCVPTGKLCVQYCANVERYAQNRCVSQLNRERKN